MHEEFSGPYWCADLIGANGKLSKLFKGGPKPPATPPPPVRESNRNTAMASDAERMKAAQRKGYASTMKPDSGSLLAPASEGAKKTLLG